jgi:glucokinase
VSLTRLFGVDVGGTGIKLGAVEIEGGRPRIVSRRVIHEHRGRSFEAGMDLVAASLTSLADELGWGRAHGLGIGCPGLVLRDEGVLTQAPNLPSWNGGNLRRALRSRTGLEVRVDNDANAFALAEWLWGAGEGARDAVFLTLGTGIGGGLVSAGHMLRGRHGFAGEPGHMTLVRDGIPCPCGNSGCAERYVGNKAIVDRALAHPGLAADPFLSGLPNLTPRALSEAAEQGSAAAREVWEEVGGALGGLLVSLVNLLDPERIVIGGGVAQAGAWIFEPARRHLLRFSLVARQAPPEVVPATLGTDAGMLGAAGLFVEDASSPEA